jgi:Carboxypeptidase regulatory-like domain
MPHSLLAVLLLASQFVLPSRLSPQQSSLNSSSCPCTLRGTIVDSVTGNPIHGAFVQAYTGSPWSAFTDSEGKFQFDALPAGPITVQAAKPGYLSNGVFDAQAPKAYSLQLGPDAAPAILKLTPEGVIFGQVTDEDGEPLEGFIVSLIYRNPLGRGLSPNPRQRAVTDDEGKFRLAGLQPGTCYLALRPTEGPALTSTKNADAPQGFAPVFYPSALGIDSAIPIKVRPGRPSQANFSLKREPFVRLSGTVSGYSPEQQAALNLQDSLGEPMPQQIALEASTGNFQSKWIPPGAYTLSAQTYLQLSVDASRALSSARQSINANSSLSGIHLVLQPTVNIPVVVRGLPSVDSENDASPSFMLLLLAKGQPTRGLSHYATTANRSSDAPSGPPSLVVAGVEPGIYEVNAAVYRGGSYYLESISWGSTDLLHDPLVLDTSGAVPPIDVVVREGAATLNGTVVSGDQPSSAAVVVFPPDQRMPPSFAFSGPDGSFMLQNLAPGSYRVMALENFAGLDLENQNVLRSISAKAQEVMLSKSQTASVRLELTTVGE